MCKCRKILLFWSVLLTYGMNKCMLITLHVLARNGKRSKKTVKSGKRVAANEADAVATKRGLFTCVVSNLLSV